MGVTVLFKGSFQLWKGSVCSGAAYYSDSSKSFSGTADDLSPFRMPVYQEDLIFLAVWTLPAYCRYQYLTYLYKLNAYLLKPHSGGEILKFFTKW
jgi:hypothetical protein